MADTRRRAALWRVKLISLAVASCFAGEAAYANPTGATVVNGTASIHQQGNLLQITNSPNSIIHWQSFSIGAGEITRFLQQSASSAVLNRVITQNPSAILGALQSNGRVFLINPNGILFGAGAQIDVAGLIASTLNLSDADFLAGRLRFTEVPGAGSVINQGAINAAQGGQVYLVGPAVTNSGIITSPQGEVILAAGNAVELVEPGTPNLRVEITAPDNLAVNLGRIIADAGRVGIYAGLINHSGTIRANSAVVTEDGRIVLKATKNVTLEAGSVTTASGPKGGSITAQADGGMLLASGTIEARGSSDQGGEVVLAAPVLIQTGDARADGASGGSVSVQAGNYLQSAALSADGTQGAGGSVTVRADRIIQTVSATLSANGNGGAGGTVNVAAGQEEGGRIFSSATFTATGDIGGAITVTGRDIELRAATLDASGDNAGGTVLAGGDWSGGNPAVPSSRSAHANFSTTLRADARKRGDGGKVVVWSDDDTRFFGTVSARGGAEAGDGGRIEVSGKENLVFGGLADAGAPNGRAGALLLDPKNITIDVTSGPSATDLVDPNTGAGDQFGAGAVVLTNGNIVAPDSNDSFVATNAGAVYLFNGSTSALSSTLTGTKAFDQVGSGGVAALTNGNFVVSSPSWNNGAGAVTRASGTTGVTGVVSNVNSLVGTTAGDQVGSDGVTALTNGNYVVNSPNWNSGAGAVTWGSGTTGVTGAVSNANSLVGSTAGDLVGLGGVAALANGNYVVSSFLWNKVAAANAGAVTWGSGTTGVVGAVSALNSLVGTTANDRVGMGGVAALTNGNYVVGSPNWNKDAGAATWSSGTTGIVGAISVLNSLVGTSAGDQVGSGGVAALANGNAIVLSPTWRNGAALAAGAATWINGASGQLVTGLTAGAVSAANSLVGTKASDQVGSGGVAALTNGNAIVLSPMWGNGGALAAGAATWINGANGQLVTGPMAGAVSAANSLVGSTAGDLVSSGGATALTNGNYVVSSPSWNNGAGAVTRASGTTGVTGAVTNVNSLVGTMPGDLIGVGGVAALTNGNYVVSSPNWNKDAGAVTWGNGTAGVVGTVSALNSLVGTSAGDLVGSFGASALTNGNYVVSSPSWNNGAGAVTWGNGTTGVTGVVSNANSLVGATANDQVGSGGITEISGNRVLVGSPLYDNGAVDSGRLQIYDGSSGSFTNPLAFSDNPSGSVTITPSAITAITNTGTAVTLQANNDVALNAAITSSNPSGNGGALTLQAGRSILVNSNITTDNGNLTLVANETAANGVVNAQRDPGSAVITMAPGTAIDTGTGNLSITLGNGAGLTHSTSGAITLQALTGNAISITNSGATPGSGVTFNGPVNAGGAFTASTANSGITVNARLSTAGAVNLFGSGSGVTLNGDIVTAGAGVTIFDNVVLGASPKVLRDTTNGGAAAGGSSIVIAGTVNDDAAGTSLALRAGTNGVVSLIGDVGGTMPIGGLTVIGANAVRLPNVRTRDGGISVSTAGSSPLIRLLGNLDTTQGAGAGNVAFTGPVELLNNVQITTNHVSGADGHVTFAGAGSTVNGDGPGRSLTINAGGGDVSFGGAVGGTQALANLTVDAGNISIGANITSGPQSISATGDISVFANSSTSVSASGSQTVSAGGTLSLQGAATGTNSFARLSATGGQNITASGITLTGGGGDGNSAEIRQLGPGSSQAITINNGGTLALQGGGGTNNFARIRNEGVSQQINFPSAGSLTLTGGSGASNDFAQIRANAGTQTISGSPAITLMGGTGGASDLGNFAQISTAVGAQTITAGDTTLRAGGAGFNNTANILSPLQTMTVHGDLTLMGGSSASSMVRGGEARIGGPGVAPGATPTNLMLTVDNNVTMTGGSVANAGAVIGSSPLGTAQTTDITMNVGGNVTLNPGTVTNAGSRIGSPSAAVAGGTIIVHAGTSGTGDIVMNSAGLGLGSFIRTTGGVTLQANAITEGAGAVIQAGSLTANTANGASLIGSGNSVSNFAASNTTSGNITLTNASSLLTVTGVNQVPSGALTLNQTGNLTLTGGIFSGPQSISATGNISVLPSSPAVVNAFGPQTITAGGGLIVQSSPLGSAQITASAGQTIDAAYVEVTAQGGNAAFITNFGSGNQALTTHGANAQGEGVAVRSLGGFALIDQQAGGGFEQSVNVSNANYVRVIGGSGPAQISTVPGATQTVLIRGAGLNALEVGGASAISSSSISGGNQAITAGLPLQHGSITIQGNAAGGSNAVISSLLVPGGTQSVSTSGLLTVLGGSALVGSTAGIFANGIGGQQTISANAIALQGGSTGSGNRSQIGANNGSQQTNVGAGGIAITGGSGGSNNDAQIRQVVPSGSQMITVNGGDVTLLGGTGGTNNAAFILGSNQGLTVTTGNVFLTGGAGTGNSSIIGSLSGVATNLALSAGGDVVLTGGSATGTGANIGSTGAAPLQPTNIAINAGGDVILNAGTGTGVRIGSSVNAPAAGGDILISAGGDIQLNGTTQAATIRTLGNVTLHADTPGGTISENANGLIQANALTTTSNAGTSLTGPNEVSTFNATNIASGNLSLTNTSPLLTVTGISEVPSGALTLNQTGNLTLTGSIVSGPQTISATGNISVVPSSPAIVSASGAQTIDAGGGLIVQSSAAGSVQLSATGGQTINAGFVEVNAQDTPAIISNNVSGDQLITTSGTNAAGEGLAVRSLGGFGAFANISQSAPGQQQVINVTNADRVAVDGAGSGALIFANFFDSQGQGQGLAQTLSVTGAGANAIHVGSPGGLGASQIRGGSQNITAGASGQSGSITIVGPATNNQLAGFVSNGQQSVRTSGMISVTGGTAPAQPTNFPSGILHNGAGQQVVSAAGIMQQGGPSGSRNVANIAAHTGSQHITVGAGGITLTGGTGGTGNSAFLGALNGTQHVTVGAGGIAITGGSGGSNNIAQIQQTLPSGSQTITVDGGGIALQGGPGGTNNGAFLFGANQLITATGNVTLSGASGSGNNSIIGSLSGVATNLLLSAGGDVVLTGGSAAGTAALIGNTGAGPLQPTNIAITAGGNVMLNAGSGAGARIGSSTAAPAAGGDISIGAGESIQLNGSSTQVARIRTLGNVQLHADNPGGTISETPNGLIEANALTTTSNAGASLIGPNEVAVFNAANTTSGNVTLSNGGSLSVTGVSNPAGNIAVTNLGNLTVAGNVNAGANLVQLDALSGSIGQAGGAVTAGTAILTADTGISLTAGSIATLEATNNTSGNISITGMSGPLTVGAGGVSNSAAAGSVTLATTGALNLAGDATVQSGPMISLSGGTIASTGGAPIADTLLLNSVNGTTLSNLVATNLSATNTGAGTIDLDVAGNVTIIGPGLVNTGGNAMLTVPGNLTIGAEVNVSGTAALTAGGSITQTAGVVTGDTVTLTSTSGSIGTGASGRVNTQAGNLVANASNGGVFISELDFVNLGASSGGVGGFDLVAGGPLTVSGNVTGAGPVSLAGIGFTNNATISGAGGLTINAGGGAFTNNAGAVISGSGTLDATGTTFSNSGTLQPGGAGAVGTLTVIGNAAFNSTGVIEIEATGSGAGNHDVVAVTGTAGLSGALNVSNLGGYVPANGDSLVPVTFASASGSFIVNPAATYTATYNPTHLTLVFGVLDAINRWIGTSGNWAINSNWSLGHIPTDAETVLIDVPGLQTITVSDGRRAAFMLTSNENFSITGGRLALGGPSTFNGALTLSGGRLRGAGDVVVNGDFNWTGGKLSGPGTFTTMGTSTLSPRHHDLELRRDWTNLGTINWRGRHGRDLFIRDDATLTNAAGGTLNLRAGTSSDIRGSGELINEGTVNKNGYRTNSIKAWFSNYGTLNVNDGTLRLKRSTGNDGVINIGSHATLDLSRDHYTNRGLISGTGTLDVRDVWFTNDGTVAPGSSGGTGIGRLTIDGNYRQSANGVLQMGVGGTSSGQYDVLAITGRAYLDGTLSVEAVGGYVPHAGDSFRLLTYRSRSDTLDTTEGPAGFDLTANYGKRSATFKLVPD